MAIPNAREAPPPPLPPPRYINELNNGHDPGWQWANNQTSDTVNTLFGSNVKPGSSLRGGGQPSSQGQEHTGDDVEPFYFGAGRRTSSIATVNTVDTEIMQGDSSLDHSDEDRRPSASNHRLQSERQLGLRSLENSSNAYDKQLLSKIGGPNAANRSGGSAFLSPTSQEPPANSRHALDKLTGQLRPLSMPERRPSATDTSLSRWPSAPSSGVSPGNTGFRSPLYDQSSSEQARQNSVSTPDTVEDIQSARSKRGSDDQGIFMDHDFVGMDENNFRELNISDRSPIAPPEYFEAATKGIKRRASSPPADPTRDERGSVRGGKDLYHRRSSQAMGSRNSPVSRAQAAHGSVSSASSLGQRTAASYGSYNLSVASSATSYNGERLSPSALSPMGESEFGPISAYVANKSLNPSPRGSISKPHQRTNSENDTPQPRKMSMDSQAHSRQNSVSKIQGLYICDCCPKKPKKFDSQDELRQHELEKQYQCQYCPNRFKNKNEAERHQNSLHLRRHSWSCAALAGVPAAFHASAVHPGTADVCGYCGEEFANPADWVMRSEHLNHVHKFGECNQAKKFFRADHFRQHLKHSHAGTSGKWTNMLETACMKEEPAPTPLAPHERMGSIGSMSGSSLMSPVGGGGGGRISPGTIPGVIDEVHNES
ncbi:hypothetical protein K402DRAFT_339266 [Aulographum hederae CBS 113979]|uniref:C2H2-type domain-containing protein n=1 Tax=Aulographum hederae CBS 113979 TaxID=1176131 RepID=A0A6G1GPZ8_9PEZI|nr:hypothetical protein K402DRAFT_339266 [Aulographum hederae CBS 113979]